MPTRDQVRQLLDRGHSYEMAARELDIPAGQAYMIATGLPADGGDTPSPEELRVKPLLSGSSQQLVNPPAMQPTRNDRVMEWVRRRAARELEGGS
jgi:hypothetical protein